MKRFLHLYPSKLFPLHLIKPHQLENSNKESSCELKVILKRYFEYQILVCRYYIYAHYIGEKRPFLLYFIFIFETARREGKSDFFYLQYINSRVNI